MPDVKLPLCSLLLVLLLSLAGCGGGSGGDDFADPVAGDPGILSTSPAPFETEVEPDRPVLIEFASPLDPAADHAAYLSVTVPAGDVTGTWSYEAGARRLTFVPDTALAFGAPHTVTIAPGMPYLDGSVRTAPFSFTFGVRAVIVPAPVPAEAYGESIIGRKLRMSANGRGMLVLRRYLASGDQEVIARRKLPTGGFDEPRTILSIDDLQGGVLAVDDAGNAAYIWRYGGTVAPWNLAMRYYDRATDTWRPTRFLETNPQRSSDRPQAGFDGQGNVFIAWREQNTFTGRWRAAARRYRADGLLDATWFGEEYVGSGTVILSMHVDANDRGDAVVAWDVSDNDATRKPHAVIYDHLSDWGADRPLDATQDLRCYVRNARINDEGHAGLFVECSYVGVDDSDHMAIIPFAPADAPSPGWKDLTPFHADRGYINDYAMHLSDDGVFVAAYTLMSTSDVGDGDVRVARYSPELGVHATDTLTAAPAPLLYNGYFHSALAPDGSLFAAWTEEDYDVQSDLYAGIQRPDGTAIRSVFLDRLVGTLNHAGLEVAAAPGGGGFVAWEEDDLLDAPRGEILRGLSVVRDGTHSDPMTLRDLIGSSVGGFDVHIDERGQTLVLFGERNTATDHDDVLFLELR